MTADRELVNDAQSSFTARNLYIERWAFDAHQTIDETGAGPLSRLLDTLVDYVGDRGIDRSEAVIRHLESDGYRADRMRLNVLEHGDLAIRTKNAAALGHLSIDEIDEFLTVSVPSLNESREVNAKSIRLSSPSSRGDRFLEFITNRKAAHQREAWLCREALAQATGEDITARITNPRVRLAWIRRGARPSLGETLRSLVEESVSFPLAIDLQAALPLPRP